MKRKGLVVEVFIPVKGNESVMSSSKIGFKIKVDNEIIEVIEEQNIINANIHKDDQVIVEDNNSIITIKKVGSINE
ncbi:MAG: hypothetical protein MRZ42_01145 [Tenericutes bacterium]|nr:hypothetical protein [Mycoplasmatota bacterium]